MSIEASRSQVGAGGKRKRSESKGSGSVTMSKAVVNVNNAPVDDVEAQLCPSKEDAVKLAAVIRMLDKHGIGNEHLPEEAGVSTLLEALNQAGHEAGTHTIQLLEFYLDLASSSVKARLADQDKSSASNTIENGPSTASTSTLQPPVQAIAEKEVDHLISTIRAVLEEIKDATALRTGHKRVKQGSKPKYALHRIVGGIDVFTSASDSLVGSDKQPIDTDVVAVYPTELAEPSYIPRLGEINPSTTSVKRPIEFIPQIEPVSFLYYDPYQSFAPTYDSSTATLSYAQSVGLGAGRDLAQEWEERPLPPLPPVEPAGPVRPSIDDTLSAIDPSLLSSSDVNAIDPSELKVYLRAMEESQVIDQRLQENTELLRALQEAQWQRLRKSDSKTTELELSSAKRLLESLTSLANARPRTPDLSSNASPWDINPAISASLIQIKSKAYYGTLDKTNIRAIPDYVMTKEGGISKGATGAEMTRKNSTQGHKKKKNKTKHNTTQNGIQEQSPAGAVLDLPVAPVKQETPAM